jgi:hypothetical protein
VIRRIPTAWPLIPGYRPGNLDISASPSRGSHWTASARAYHWKAVRAAAGWEGSLYLATRHFAGWYMVNVLELPS